MKRADLTAGMVVAIGSRTRPSSAGRYVILDARPWLPPSMWERPAVHTLPDGTTVEASGIQVPRGTGVLVRHADSEDRGAHVETLVRVLAPWADHEETVAADRAERARVAAADAERAAAARDRRTAAETRAGAVLGRAVQVQRTAAGGWTLDPADVEALLDAAEGFR